MNLKEITEHYEAKRLKIELKYEVLMELSRKHSEAKIAKLNSEAEAMLAIVAKYSK